jgi:hypothetical protein
MGDLDAMVVTIDSARVQSFSNNYLKGGDEKVVLTFKEFGDAEYVLNATSFHALGDRYGKNVDQLRASGFKSWMDKPCVLVREETEDPRNPGAKIQAVWVARPAQWSEAMRAIAAQTPKRVAKQSAKKTAGKRAGR